MKTVISDLQGVVMTNGAGLSGTFVENSLTIAGNVGFGSASPGVGKVIATITLTAGGTSYVNLNYAQQALTGGTGTGATADISVVGGIVTVCTLRGGGVGYVVGDVLSCTTIGAGVGLIVTVTTVASSVASDGIVVAPRIGAGTTTPRSALDVVGGATIDGVAQRTIWNTGTNNPINVLASLSIGSAGAPAIIANPNAGAYVVTVTPVFDVSALTYQSSIGVYSSPVLYTSPAGYTGTIFGTSAAVYRREPGDTATAMQIQGVASNVGIVSTVGSATTLRAFAYRGGVFNTAANHTINEAWFALTGFAVTTATSVITSLSAFDVPEISGVGTVGTFYGLRIRASTTPTITNRIGISQEDTLSRNFFAGSVGIGTTSPAELLAVQAPLGVNSVVDILSLKNPSANNAGVRISLRNVYGDLGGVKARQTDNGAGADDGVLELQTSTNAILSTKMTILSNGRVGIGTETPAYKLQVGSFAGYGGQVDGLSVDTIITRLVDFGSTGYSGSTIYMPSSGELLIRAGSSHSGPTRMSFYTQHDYVQAERVCINHLGNVGIGTTSPLANLSVASSTYNAPGLTNKGAMQIAFANSNGLSFGSYDSGSYSTYIQGISSPSGITVVYPISLNPVGGNVGVGTASPATKTEVSGDSGVSAGGSTPIALRISATDVDGGANTWSLTSPFTALQFYSADTSGSGASVRAQVGAVMETLSGGYSALAMYTHTVGTPLERMRISSGGNVGIGTTSPASALDVAGTITCDDAGTGIKLPASPGNADVQTLDCYSEGSWTVTDTSGAGLIITPTYAPIVTRCGRLVTFMCDITYPVTASTLVAQIALPIAIPTSGYRGHGSAYSSVGDIMSLFLLTDALLYIGASRVTNATLSGARIMFSATYAIS